MVTSVQRSVARDTVEFMGTLSEFGAGGSVLNSIGIIIDSLLNSKFFRFTVVMASFGDKIQTTWKKGGGGFYNYGQAVKNVDDLPNHSINRIKKSRKRKGEKGRRSARDHPAVADRLSEFWSQRLARWRPGCIPRQECGEPLTLRS